MWEEDQFSGEGIVMREGGLDAREGGMEYKKP